MLIISIAIGIFALVAAHQSKMTFTWMGTGKVALPVLVLCILAIPGCHWLFDIQWIWLLGILWLGYTTFLHSLFRQMPQVDSRRFAFVWNFGRLTVGFAMGVS